MLTSYSSTPLPLYTSLPPFLPLCRKPLQIYAAFRCNLTIINGKVARGATASVSGSIYMYVLRRRHFLSVLLLLLLLGNLPMSTLTHALTHSQTTTRSRLLNVMQVTSSTSWQTVVSDKFSKRDGERERCLAEMRCRGRCRGKLQVSISQLWWKVQAAVATSKYYWKETFIEPSWMGKEG